MTKRGTPANARLVAVTLDENSIGRSGPDIEHERAVAIYDLIEQNSFAPDGKVNEKANLTACYQCHLPFAKDEFLTNLAKLKGTFPSQAQVMAKSGPTEVAINGFQFGPGTLKINAGQKVTWTNADDTPHQITITGADGRRSEVMLKGQMEGDTFVAETAGFNGKPWLDQAGYPASDALRITERFRRRDFGHMDMEMVIDDRKMYSKPWSIFSEFTLQADTELLEFICEENEKDSAILDGK